MKTRKILTVIAVIMILISISLNVFADAVAPIYPRYSNTNSSNNIVEESSNTTIIYILVAVVIVIIAVSVIILLNKRKKRGEQKWKSVNR